MKKRSLKPERIGKTTAYLEVNAVRDRELLLEIERSREEMNQLSKSLPLSSGEVLAKSRRLDSLLNSYQKKIPY